METERDPADLTLSQIAEEALTLHNTLRVRTTVTTAIRIGELLLEAKSRLPHGRFKRWVATIGLHYRSAAVYMQVARAPEKMQASASSIDGLLRVISTGKKAEKRQRQLDAIAALPTSAEEPNIIVGDSLAVMREMPTGSVPFIVTDPPYGIGFKYDGWTEPDNAADYIEWFAPYWAEMRRVLAPGGVIAMWQSHRYLAHLQDWYSPRCLTACCFHVRGLSMWEPVVVWAKDGVPLKRVVTDNDWLVAHNDTENPYYQRHPCPKRYAAAQAVVERYTLPTSLVFDPFCGIGAIPLAAARTGRKYLGVEQNAGYVAVAKERLAKVAA